MSLSLNDAIAISHIVDASMHRRPVARALSDGTVVYATANIICGPEGEPANHAPVHTLYLQVFEDLHGKLHRWPIAELMPETRDGRFLVDVERPKPTVTVHSPWRSAGPADDPTERYLGHATFSYAGHSVSCHLEAWAVETTDDGQDTTFLPIAVGDLAALSTAVGGDGPFRTITIGGRQYVVVMTPYCQ